MLTQENLPHNVLNAKQHAREAEIIAQAGRPKMITIATNMAGRGTDIVLGGNVDKQVQLIDADSSLTQADKDQRAQTLRDEWQSLHEQVVAAGGLHIIGTERHESRRIDNQLRGRSGRQGDPGSFTPNAMNCSKLKICLRSVNLCVMVCLPSCFSFTFLLSRWKSSGISQV